MKVFRMIAKGYNKVLAAINQLMGYIILFLFVIVCVQVFARLLPIPPVMWTTDIAMYCMIVLAFLGMGYLLRTGAHVAIDLIVSKMPPKAANITGVVTSAIGAVTTAVLMVFSAMLTVNHLERFVKLPGSVWQMPRWVLSIVVPIGFAFTLIEFIVLICRYAKAAPTGHYFREDDLPPPGEE